MSSSLHEETPGVKDAENSIQTPVTDHVEDNKEFQRVELEVSQSEEAQPYRFSIWTFLALSGVIVGYIADSWNTQLAGSTYNGINAKIGPDPYDVWIGSMLQLVGSAFAPFVGYLSDIFGRRYFLLAGAFFGTFGNLGSALSNTIPQVYCTGILVGFGILFKQVSVASVAELFPRAWRPVVFGLLWTALAPGQGFSPIIGASILTYHSWRVVYWVPFALNILAFFLVLLFYHPLNQHVKEAGKSGWQQLASLDYVSGALIGFGTTMALIGVSLGEFTSGWRTAKSVALVVIGLVLVIAVIPWGYSMRKRLHYPMYPRAAFRHYRRYTLNLLPTGSLALTASTGAFIWPLLVQTLFEQQDPIKAGWFSSAPLIAGVFLAPAFGLLFQKFGYQSNWIITGLAALLTMFTALQAIVTPSSKTGSTVLACFVNVAWTGLLVGFGAVFQLVPHRYLGTSTATYSWIRSCINCGGALIFPTTLKNTLPGYLVHNVAIPLAKLGVNPLLIPQVIEALTTTTASKAVLAQLPPQALLVAVNGVEWAYVHTFRVIFYSTLAWGGFGTLIAALTKSFGPMLTPAVEIQLLKGIHIKAKHNTGKGPVIGSEQWM